MHPHADDLYATAGDDRTARVWSFGKRRQVAAVGVPCAARAVAWWQPEPGSGGGGSVASWAAPGPSYLAVGLGKAGDELAGAGSGTVVLFEHVEGGDAKPDALRAACRTPDTGRAAVTELKVAPAAAGAFPRLAVGAADGGICVLELLPGGAGGAEPAVRLECFFDLSAHERDTLKLAPAAVAHFDWSSAGEFLQTNTADGELRFWEVPKLANFVQDDGSVADDLGDGKTESLKQTRPSKLVFEQWQSWTCPLGWPVQGCWRGGGGEINAVHRAPGAGKYLATAGDASKVSVYYYPVVSKGAKSVDLEAHAGAVANVRWRGADPGGAMNLVSVGAADRGVFVWRLLKHS